MVVLYVSINVLNLMRAATGSQYKEIKRGVTCIMLCNANLQYRAVFTMWSLKVSCRQRLHQDL